MNKYMPKSPVHTPSNRISEQSKSSSSPQFFQNGTPIAFDSHPLSILKAQTTMGNQHIQRVMQQKAGVTHLAQNRKLLPTVIKKIDDYVELLSKAVDEASQLVETRAFIHVTPIDGYMRALFENFDQSKRLFTDVKTISRQAGYWIESYVTKVLNISAPSGMNAVLQATRGNTRPDIILIDTVTKQDIAWLDITAGSSHSINHIFSKDGDWDQVPYARELLYTPISTTNQKLNKLPAKDQKLADLSANLAKKQLEYAMREAKFIEAFGESLSEQLEKDFITIREEETDLFEMLNEYEYVDHEIYDYKKILIRPNLKKSKLKIKRKPKQKLKTPGVGEKRNLAHTLSDSSNEDIQDVESEVRIHEARNANPKKKVKIMDDEDIDNFFNPEKSNNQYALQTIMYFQQWTKQEDITPSQIASFVLAWNSMNERAFNKKLIKKKYILNKRSMGVVKEASSGSEGLVFIEDWFPTFFKDPSA